MEYRKPGGIPQHLVVGGQLHQRKEREPGHSLYQRTENQWPGRELSCLLPAFYSPFQALKWVDGIDELQLDDMVGKVKLFGL